MVKDKNAGAYNVFYGLRKNKKKIEIHCYNVTNVTTVTG